MQYTAEQKREIELGKESGIDVSLYSDSSLSPTEMKLRRLYLEYGIEIPNMKKINTQCLDLIENILKRNIDVNLEKYFENLKYDSHQIEEILLGYFLLKHPNDVSIYENPQYGWMQMRTIRQGLGNGLDVSIYADPKFDNDQMTQIRVGLEEHINVRIYANPQYDWMQMEEIRLGLLDNLDVSIYTKHEFTWSQMKEIRLGLEKGLNVSIYAKPEYNWMQMQQIRKGLGTGLDVSLYSSLELD